MFIWHIINETSVSESNEKDAFCGNECPVRKQDWADFLALIQEAERNELE
jgi:hypothetical protein